MNFSKLSVLGLLALATQLPADIPAWRNDGNGKYPAATAALSWDGKDLWSTPLPDRSNACPIIVGDKIFLTAEPTQLLCLDRKSGKILWSKSNSYEDVLEVSKEVRTALLNAKEKAESLKGELDPLKRDLYKLQRATRRNPDDKELKQKARALQKKIKGIEGAPDPVIARFQIPR